MGTDMVKDVFFTREREYGNSTDFSKCMITELLRYEKGQYNLEKKFALDVILLVHYILSVHTLQASFK